MACSRAVADEIQQTDISEAVGGYVKDPTAPRTQGAATLVGAGGKFRRQQRQYGGFEKSSANKAIQAVAQFRQAQKSHRDMTVAQ